MYQPSRQSRHISELTRDAVALILAGGKDDDLIPLTWNRTKASVPFGGKYQLIDFTLSNCLNSGIRTLGICTQYLSRELGFHLQKTWGHLRGQFGDFVALLPAEQGNDQHPAGWYSGTADAVYQNLRFIKDTGREYVLILSGDQVYKMDYGPMLAQHVESGADITLGVVQVPLESAHLYGVVKADKDNRIRRFCEKPSDPQYDAANPSKALASMGVYVVSRHCLEQLLKDDHVREDSAHDFGQDILPRAVEQMKVFGYRFTRDNSRVQQYWRDVGNLDAYYATNMDLLAVEPELNLYDSFWPIWADQTPAPGAKMIFENHGNGIGTATNSIISGGDIISGASVRRSLLFTYVHIDKHTQVEDSLLLHRVKVGKHCLIRNAIIDEECELPDGTRIGVDPASDKERFHVTDAGVVVVTKEMLC